MKDYSTIKDYAKNNNIELPSIKNLAYSDLYVKIFRKYECKYKEENKRIPYYRNKDLLEFFEQNKLE